MDWKKSLKTLFVLCAGLIILGFLFRTRWLLFLSLALFIPGILVPPAGKGIARAWLKLSEILGWFTSRILLTLLYYCLLFPVAVLSRLFSPDRLALKKGQETLFHIRNHLHEKKDLVNPW